MVKVKQAIVVEGRYDKNTLSQMVDCPIFETNGFGVMNNRELVSLLRIAAQTRGLVIFTDPDGAGFVIRNYLRGVLPKENVFHAYVPDIFGKERRKSAPGKEGKLGVEGMSREIILKALRDSGAELDGQAVQSASSPITKQDLFLLGLSGGADSSAKRKALQKKLALPEHMSANALLQALNLLFSREEFLSYQSNEEQT